MSDQKPPIPCEIGMFFHCSKCLEELPGDKSPAEWCRINVGWTRRGFQVWCKRHEINIINIDFQGNKVDVVGADPTPGKGMITGKGPA